jgi:hypothetical protein
MTMLARHWTEPQVEGRTGLRSRATRWIVAAAKKVFPASVVLGGCAALVAATIALRLAIWLPMYLHH